MPIDDRTKNQFEKWGVPPPSSEAHGTPQELKDNRERVMPSKWHQEGNKLIGKHQIGTVVNFVPPDMLYHGQDENGKHIFKKVGKESRDYLKSKLTSESKEV